jgi:hypothetical protein
VPETKVQNGEHKEYYATIQHFPWILQASSTKQVMAALMKECPAPACAQCHVKRMALAGDRKMRQCGNCRAVWYCGIDCQRLHWLAEHSALCKDLVGHGDEENSNDVAAAGGVVAPKIPTQTSGCV